LGTDPVWNRFLTAQDRAVYGLAGYGRRGGPGVRPAVLVVDMNYDFVGFERLPLVEAVRRWRTACGEAGWAAVDATAHLLAAARRAGAPVFYSTGVPRTAAHKDHWARKNERTAREAAAAAAPAAADGRDGNDFPPAIAPLPGDYVVRKESPSPFFGTPLASHLIGAGVDTLLVVGGTTSGCVRAAVIDAFSYRFRIQIVAEGCFDRGEASHAINLFDMHQKYADVIPLAEAIDYLATAPAP